MQNALALADSARESIGLYECFPDPHQRRACTHRQCWLPAAQHTRIDSHEDTALNKTDSNQIAYRRLTRAETAKLGEIDRRETVEAVYRVCDGKLILTPLHWEIPGFDDLDDRIDRLVRTHQEGGVLFGAFDGTKLVGMSVLEKSLRGARKDRIQMSGLWVSRDYRRCGIGRRLVDLVKASARECGASYLYISGTRSESTVSFYLSIGCSLAAEVDPELYAKEPYDIHFDLAL